MVATKSENFGRRPGLYMSAMRNGLGALPSKNKVILTSGERVNVSKETLTFAYTGGRKNTKEHVIIGSASMRKRLNFLVHRRQRRRNRQALLF
jgi:hypothetical protein